MSIHILDLPDEILELILFYVLSDPWENDVLDYLSFTSTCQRFHRFSNNEKFWEKLALRRDPTDEKPSDCSTWLDYCKTIYLMRTIPSNALVDKISRFNADYFCTVEKVIIWPNLMRVYIDERGDYSLGAIQNPRHSSLIFGGSECSTDENNSHIKKRMFDFRFATPNRTTRPLSSEGDGKSSHVIKHVCNCKFSIQDPTSRYLGYLDFAIDLSSDSTQNEVCFEFGESGYSTIKLFQIGQRFIEKFNLLPLLRRSQNIL